MSKKSNTNVIASPFISKQMYGRRKIYSSVDKIDSSNVVDVITNAYNTHLSNRSEIDYLYNYYKGKQPVLGKIKNFREDINNRMVVNRAYEIVSFKVGYMCGEPMQYTSVGNETVSKKVEQLNKFMSYENKASKDKELVEWQMICGTSYRIALPDDKAKEDETPFEINNLNPKDTFVVYSNRIGEKPLCGVTYWTNEIITGENKDYIGDITFAVYTDTEYFEIRGDKIVSSDNHILGGIPIVEYPANNSRLGAFEIVLDILDGISKIESNRLDGLDQYIQSFIKFINCDIDREEYEYFLQNGAIKVNSHEGKNADVDVVSSELSQTQTQVEVEDLYETILTICGMPNRNGGSSTSDTGSASYLRDGWSSAETRAKDTEIMFKDSDKKLLSVILNILRDKGSIDLKVSEVDMKFPRRNYENIQSKSQILVTMLNNPKIHPSLAFKYCDMFPDSETAYEMSMEYYEEQMNKWEVEEVNEEEENDVSESRQTSEKNTDDTEEGSDNS